MGSDGDDNIITSGADNRVAAGAGADTIIAVGFGADTLLGGAGDDLIKIAYDTAIAAGGGGVDTLDIRAILIDLSVDLDSGVSSLAGRQYLNFEMLFTGAGNDFILGSAS